MKRGWSEGSGQRRPDNTIFLDPCNSEVYYACLYILEMAKTDRIGEFLVKIKAITPEQVQAVLHLQELGDTRRFGELALLLGYISDDAIKRYVDYLEKQKGG